MLALSRNYNAAYLAQIGAPGTGGCMAARNGAPLSRSVMAVAVGLPSMPLSLSLPVPSWRISPDWWPAQNTFSLDPGATVQLSGKLYANRDGSEPRLFASAQSPYAVLGAYGESAAWQFTEIQPYGNTDWEATAYLSLNIREIRYPWWGSAPSPGPGDGYAAPEGRWAMRYEATLAVLATTVPESASFNDRDFTATASGWFHSDAAFHRIRGSRRTFSHAGNPDVRWSRWPRAQDAPADEEAFADWHDAGSAACSSALGNFLSSARPYLQVVDAGDWTP